MPSGFWSLGLIGWARRSSCCSHSLLGNLGRGRFLRELWNWTCRGLWRLRYRNADRRKSERQEQAERDGWRHRQIRVGRNNGGGGGADRKKNSVKYSLPYHHRSSSAPGHNKLCPVTMVTGQTVCFPPFRPREWNSPTQWFRYLQMHMGMFADHWLLSWQEMVFSPISSKPNWHSNLRMPPFEKLSPSRIP